MKYLARVFMPLMMFFLTFIVVGELNVEQKNSEICNSDYYFRLSDDSTEEEEKAFVECIKEYVKENNIDIYGVWNERLMWDKYITVVYSTEATRDAIKERIECKNDKELYTSLFVGERTVEFRDIEGIADTKALEDYYVNCSQEEFDKFFDAMSQEFSFECAMRGHYALEGNRNMVIALWCIIAFVLIMYKYFDNSSEKKRIYIRYVNGVDKNKQILINIVTNTLIFVLTFFAARYIASNMTSIYFCTEFGYRTLLVILVVTNLHLLTFVKINMRRILTRDNISRGVIRFMEISTTVIIVVTMLCLSTNIRSIYDSYQTVKQDKIWKEYKDYESIYFESGMIHFDRSPSVDASHMKKFYERYIDEYNLKFNFDVINNSRGSSKEIRGNYPIVYVNKNCKEEIAGLGLDVEKMTDKYYVISKYSKEELKNKGVFDDLEFVFGYTESELTVIEMKKNFEWFTYDVRMENLSDNYKKNPVIVYNTTSEVVDDRYIRGGEYMTSLVKLKNDSDFEDFIKEIGYENDVYYSENVYDVFKEGWEESMNTLKINLMISLLMLVLFNAVIATVLKLDFDARAEEVAISKVLGKGLLKRYKKIIKYVVLAYIISAVVSGVIVTSVYNFHVGYLLVGCGITLINLIVLVTFFVRNYESRCIINILKGGR